MGQQVGASYQRTIDNSIRSVDCPGVGGATRRSVSIGLRDIREPQLSHRAKGTQKALRRARAKKG